MPRTQEHICAVNWAGSYNDTVSLQSGETLVNELAFGEK